MENSPKQYAIKTNKQKALAQGKGRQDFCQREECKCGNMEARKVAYFEKTGSTEVSLLRLIWDLQMLVYITNTRYLTENKNF